MRSSRQIRLVRRVRTLRRRVVGPRLTRLGARLASLWTDPSRRTVAWQLRRLALSLEASLSAAARIAAAEERLSRDLERLGDAFRPHRRETPGPPGPPVRLAVVPGSLAVGLTLAATGLALAAANAWLLDRVLIPPVLERDSLRLVLVPGPWLAIPFSTLALVLGLFHFALFTTGRSAWLRLLGAAAVLLLLAQGSLQAWATVVAVQAWAGPVTGTWAGMAALVLLAGAAGLVPPVIGATAHASMDRVSRWSATREYRRAGRAGDARDRLAARLERSLQQLSAGVAALRAETATIPEGDAARLLVRPAPEASVERLAGVLRRLALSVERDPAAEPTAARTAPLRYLADLGALALWLLAAGASLSIATPAAGAVATGGASGLVAAAALGALLALLIGGLLLRLGLERPGRRTDPAAAGAAALLLTVAAAALASGLVALAAAGSPAGQDPRAIGALLTVLAMTAALASARLPEAIMSAGAAVRLAAGGVAWSGLRVADLALAAADLALAGHRRARRPHRRRRVGAAAGNLGTRAGTR
jgi:hypothetical protein